MTISQVSKCTTVYKNFEMLNYNSLNFQCNSLIMYQKSNYLRVRSRFCFFKFRLDFWKKKRYLYFNVNFFETNVYNFFITAQYYKTGST